MVRIWGMEREKVWREFEYIPVFMPTWWRDHNIITESEIPRWLFKLPFKQEGSTFWPYLTLPSKSHLEILVSLIFYFILLNNMTKFCIVDFLFGVIRRMRRIQSKMCGKNDGPRHHISDWPLQNCKHLVKL